jgi:hypothetical protein
MSKTIVVSEEGMFTNEPVSIPMMADMFCAALTGSVQQARLSYMDSEHCNEIEKELFDCLNYSFSKCLDNAFPSIALRPDITEEALLRAENEIIMERADNIIPIPLTNGVAE